MQTLRALMQLSRLGQLPAVWAHCVAGWWLAGMGHQPTFALLMIGATLLYLGGTFLNDAFDAEHDIAQEKARPIPRGWMTEKQVWSWGLYLLATGGLLLMWIGLPMGLLGLSLIFTIVVHNTIHRMPGVAPALLGLCHFWLYPLAASTARGGVDGMVIWPGLAMGCYTAGVFYAGKQRDNTGLDRYWPVILLVLPIGLAWLINPGAYRSNALLLSGILALWTLKCLRQLWKTSPEPAQAMAGLASGLVLVDWLAITHPPRALSLVFLGLLGLSLLFHKLDGTASEAPGKPAAP